MALIKLRVSTSILENSGCHRDLASCPPPLHFCISALRHFSGPLQKASTEPHSAFMMEATLKHILGPSLES
jgi:hypothetical protein